MSVFSENELYSLDIVNEFSLESENPILYGIYLARNPELNQDEKDNIKYYMNKLIKNSRTLTKRI
jgi:hypothetical protein